MSGELEHKKQFADFLRRILAARSKPESFLDETMGAENGTMLEGAGLSDARRALEKVLQREDEQITVDELGQLEAIVSKTECPTILIRDDGLVDPPGGTWARLTDDESWLVAFIRASGRIDCRALDAGYAGTAFLVADHLVMTNRHVALQFAYGLGAQIEMSYACEVDYKREQATPHARDFVKVVGVKIIHPYWDMAILEVEPKNGRSPVPLAPLRPGAGGRRPIAVVGYPGIADASNPYEEQVIEHNFGRDRGKWKRLQPGVTDSDQPWSPTDRRFPTVVALTHTASTLAGNSGSLVVDLDAKEVIGLHFAGVKYKANYCVPTWKLFADERVRALGLKFSRADDVGSTPADPEVQAAWDKLKAPARATVLESIDTGGSPAPSTAREQAASRDWFEVATREDVSEALQTHEGRARIRLAAGVQQTLALESALQKTREEAAVAIDPSLPEIVLLHGFLGGHLDNVGFGSKRTWLSPWTFVRRALGVELKLASNGIDESIPGRRLEPAGLIQLLYRTAAEAWRKAGFVVHELGFDWRKRVELSADRLHFFIEGLAVSRPRRFAIVAHSMGGVVAALYAQRHREWQERIQRVVLIGTPLRGTFAPVQAALGCHPVQTKLDFLGVAGLDELATTMRSFPGLAQLLPDPIAFDARELYSAATWPANARPTQATLDEARNVKALVRESPILERACVIASLTRPTIDALVVDRTGWTLGAQTGKGDGTVPAKSAIVDGLDVALVDEDHTFLPTSSDVQRAVETLLKTGNFPLELRATVARPDLERRIAEPRIGLGGPELAGAIDPSATLRRRLENGIDWRALRWLLDSELDAPPQEVG